MKTTIFKTTKGISSFFGSYLWLIYLTVMMMYCIFTSLGKLSLPDNIIPIMNKAVDLTVSHFSIIIYLSAIFTVPTILLSNMPKILQIVSSITLIVYTLFFSSVYLKITGIIIDKIGTSDTLMLSFVGIMGYVIVVSVLEILKGLFKVSKLITVESTIKHKKLEELIEEYYSENTKFNMSLCDELMKKYGGLKE